MILNKILSGAKKIIVQIKQPKNTSWIGIYIGTNAIASVNKMTYSLKLYSNKFVYPLASLFLYFLHKKVHFLGEIPNLLSELQIFDLSLQPISVKSLDLNMASNSSITTLLKRI